MALIGENSMMRSVIYKYVVSSVIQNLYENLEATLWILEMTKRSKSVLISDVGYQAIIGELD